MSITREALLSQAPATLTSLEGAVALTALNIMEGYDTEKTVEGAELVADVYEDCGERDWRVFVIHPDFGLIAPNGIICNTFYGDRFAAIMWASHTGYLPAAMLAMALDETEFSDDQLLAIRAVYRPVERLLSRVA